MGLLAIVIYASGAAAVYERPRNNDVGRLGAFARAIVWPVAAGAYLATCVMEDR